MQTSLTDSEYISKTQGQAWCISEAEELNEMYCCKQLRDKNPHIVYNRVILSVDVLFLFSNLCCHCQSAIFFLLQLFSHNHLELVGFVRFHHRGLLFYFIFSSLKYFLPEEMFKKTISLAMVFQYLMFLFRSHIL